LACCPRESARPSGKVIGTDLVEIDKLAKAY